MKRTLSDQRKDVFVNRRILDDLEFILDHTKDMLKELKDKRLFITGGTGFFGCWLLETLIWANKRFGLNLSATVLTRDYKSFEKKAPHLAKNPILKFYVGDVRNFSFPEEKFDYVIHFASASAVEKFKGADPIERFNIIVQGTRHVLDFCVECGAKKLLYTSSGYIYGDFNFPVSEDYNGSVTIDDPNAPLGIGKKVAEFFCYTYAKKYGLEIKIARCFSFLGPYLQLNIHYAVGNFIRDAILGGPIIVKGDGMPIRSYMYASDLMIWLLHILLRGKSFQPYNVGSDQAISIRDLAYLVAECTGVKEVVFQNKISSGKRYYVPSIELARRELGLDVFTPLREAIIKTFNFYKP